MEDGSTAGLALWNVQLFAEEVTLPKTNKLHLKMDGWNTIVAFWGVKAYFQGRAVSFREGTSIYEIIRDLIWTGM